MEVNKTEKEQPNNYEKLNRVFINVNEWLKFAETKNGTLIAFNSASIFGVLKFIDPKDLGEIKFSTFYLIMVLIFLVFSTVITLISFVPKLKIIKTGLFASGSDSNVLFHEYLKNQSDKSAFNEITGGTYENGSKIEQDLANQIVQNSIIASRKYSHFTIAIWLTISAYITILPALIFWIYDYTKQ